MTPIRNETIALICETTQRFHDVGLLTAKNMVKLIGCI